MYKEEILFEILKDTAKTSTDEKRGLLSLKYPDVDFSALHRRIVNYQVEKYGCNISTSTRKTDYIRKAENTKKRRKK